jgi:hypothetical protein
LYLLSFLPSVLLASFLPFSLSYFPLPSLSLLCFFFYISFVFPSFLYLFVYFFVLDLSAIEVIWPQLW